MKFHFTLVALLMYMMSSCQFNEQKAKTNKSDTATVVPVEYHLMTDEERKFKFDSIVDIISHYPTNKIKLYLLNGRQTTLAFYPDSEYAVLQADTPVENPSSNPPIEKSFYKFDKKKESQMILYYLPHGFFNYSIFQKKGKGNYEEIFHSDYYVEIDTPNNGLNLCLNKLFRYAWAPGGADVSSEVFGEWFTPYVKLKFNNDHFEINQKIDVALNNKVLKYLNLLKRRSFSKKLNNMDTPDDGTRKTYAALIIQYYFNNHCDLNKTKKVFFTYYNGNDAKDIWDDIKYALEDDFKAKFPNFPKNNLSQI